MNSNNSKKTGGVAQWSGTSWSHRVRVLQEDGSTKYSRRAGFETKALAEESFRKYEEEYKKACREHETRAGVDSNISFTDYLKYWLEELYALRTANTSRALAAFVLYNLLIPNIEDDIRLKYVSTDYLDRLLATVSTACESAGNKSRELLNLAMKDAVLNGLIRTNPVPGTRTYPRKKPKIKILNKENLKKLLKAASMGDWYLEILLATFLGLRKGEILGLKHSDVYYDERGKFYYADIKRQITTNPIVIKGSSDLERCEVIEKEPKSEAAYRKLRIPAKVYDEIILRKMRNDINKEKLGDKYYDGDYISAQNNGLPHTTSSMNAALSKLCERNALPHITVHSLRHVYATILLEIHSVPIVKIAALLGHESVNTTFEYYADMMDENEKVISFMNDTFEVDND